MPADSRRKGASGEREACRAIEDAFGLPHSCLCRNMGEQARGGKGGDILGIPGVHIEVKRRGARAAVEKWLAQADADRFPEDISLVVYRLDGNTEWRVVYRLSDSFELMQRVLKVHGKPLYPAEQSVYGPASTNRTEAANGGRVE